MDMTKKRVPYAEQREFVVRKLVPHMKEGNTWSQVADLGGLKLEVKADKPGGVAKEKTAETRAIEMVEYVVKQSRAMAAKETCKIPEKLLVLADAIEQAAARVMNVEDSNVDDLLSFMEIDPDDLPEIADEDEDDDQE